MNLGNSVQNMVSKEIKQIPSPPVLISQGSQKCMFISPPHVQEECSIKQIYAINQSKFQHFLEWFIFFLSGGISHIIIGQIPKLRLKLYFSIVPVKQSVGVFIVGPDEAITLLYYLKDIPENKKIFEYRFQRYLLNEIDVFEYYGESALKMTNKQLYDLSLQTEFNSERIQNSYERNGQNTTDVPDKGLLKLCLNELLSPFYFFQTGSFVLWLTEEYYIYAYVIISAVFVSFFTKIYTERTNFLRLKALSILRKEVIVQRKGAHFPIPSNEIIFGEIVILNKGETASCDLIVIQGSAIVNESMLTGDSLPFAKSPLPKTTDAFSESRSFVIFSGSMVMSQSNLKCLAFRLGFETMRGNMIRSIMYPKKFSSVSFNTDTVYFIFIMGVAAIISFFATLSTFLDKMERHLITGTDVIIRCLDLATISVPPALPTCLSFGITFAMFRLKRKQVFCLNSHNIHTSGVVRTICLDKTGTLTQNLLNFNMVSGFQRKEEKFVNCEGSKGYQNLELIQRIIIGACHNLKMVKNNQYLGDPLDIEMFLNSGCEISKKSSEQLQWEGYGVIQEILVNQRSESKAGFQADPIYVKLIQQSELHSNDEKKEIQFSHQEIDKDFLTSNLKVKNKEDQLTFKDQNFKGAQSNQDSDKFTQQNEMIILLKNDQQCISPGHIMMKMEELDKQKKYMDEVNELIKNQQFGNSSLGGSERDNVIEKLNQEKNTLKIDILKVFPFESKYERMSAIVRISGITFILTKGSPEKMKMISRSDTLPKDSNEKMNTFEGKLREFTCQGFRVLALGYKQLDTYDIGKPRKKLEKDLIFQGFLVFENQLKKDTVQYMNALNDCKVSINMVTGDHPQTSLCIAKQCNLFSKNKPPILLDYVDDEIVIEKEGEIVKSQNLNSILKDMSSQLVVTGSFFDKFFILNSDSSNLSEIRNLMFMTKVFARMKPDQKQVLIRLLQSQTDSNNHTCVGVCGDGANDCQALKCSDMGICLGESEASASATYTSKVLNIGVIETVLREGRCCLVTSFQCFKFMALYSLIQVSTTAIMYFRGVVPSNHQFLYWDLGIILPLAFLLGLTKASDKLADSSPPHRLFSPNNIVSVCGLGMIQLTFLIISVISTAGQSWYLDPFTYQKESGLEEKTILMNSFDNTVLFWTSNMQYIGSLIAFSLFSIHKKPFYSNIGFTIYLVSIIIFSMYLQFTINPLIVDAFDIYPQLTDVSGNILLAEMEYSWRFIILALIIANLTLNLIFECFLVKIIVSQLEKIFPSLIYKGVATMTFDRKNQEDEESQSIQQASSKKDIPFLN